MPLNIALQCDYSFRNKFNSSIHTERNFWPLANVSIILPQRPPMVSTALPHCTRHSSLYVCVCSTSMHLRQRISPAQTTCCVESADDDGNVRRVMIGTLHYNNISSTHSQYPPASSAMPCHHEC